MRDDNSTSGVIFQRTLPGWAALILAAPLLLVAFSLALTLLAGGAVALIVLPLLRWNVRGGRRSNPTVPGAQSADQKTIELDHTSIHTSSRRSASPSDSTPAGSQVKREAGLVVCLAEVQRTPA